ncbi:MAG: GyrI-like domain-containing protein [Kosmotoga sp.]|nr:MAG: GyrI-like domain-containing protein [Kosmotoga sp.]
MDKLGNTYNHIYNEWLPQSNYGHVGKFDFELYNHLSCSVAMIQN